MTKTATAPKAPAARKPVARKAQPKATAPVVQVQVTEGVKKAEVPVDKRPKVWCWISPQAIDRIRKEDWLGLGEDKFRLDTRQDGGGSFLNPTPKMLDVLEHWAQQQYEAEAKVKGPDRIRLQRLVAYAQQAREDMVAAGRF